MKIFTEVLRLSTHQSKAELFRMKDYIDLSWSQRNQSQILHIDNKISIIGIEVEVIHLPEVESWKGSSLAKRGAMC